MTGPRHYNTLQTPLRQADSRVTFCSKLKTHFLMGALSSSYDDDDDDDDRACRLDSSL